MLYYQHFALFELTRAGASTVQGESGLPVALAAAIRPEKRKPHPLGNGAQKPIHLPRPDFWLAPGGRSRLPLPWWRGFYYATE